MLDSVIYCGRQRAHSSSETSNAASLDFYWNWQMGQFGGLRRRNDEIVPADLLSSEQGQASRKWQRGTPLQQMADEHNTQSERRHQQESSSCVHANPYLLNVVLLLLLDYVAQLFN